MVNYHVSFSTGSLRHASYRGRGRLRAHSTIAIGLSYSFWPDRFETSYSFYIMPVDRASEGIMVCI